ncbi:hypothetical protein VUR80DRAFT_9427 [Thermomyces stellatus]
MLAGTRLAGPVTASHRGDGETRGLRAPLLGILHVDRESVAVSHRRRPLMAATEGVSRRRKRSVIRGRFVALRGRVAPVDCSVGLGRRRHLDTRGSRILLELLLLKLLKLLQLLQLLKLLKLLLLLLQCSILRVLRLIVVLLLHLAGYALVHNVGRLTGRGINEGVDIGLRSSRGCGIPPLVVAVHAIPLLLLLLLLLELNLLTDAKTLELLGRSLDVAQLLLEALLLLSEVRVRCNQLGVNAWIHLLLSLRVELKLGRGKDLLGGVLLAQLGERAERHSLVPLALYWLMHLVPLVPKVRHSSLGRVVRLLGACVHALIAAGILMWLLGQRGLTGPESGSRCRLRSGPEAGKKVRTTGPRGGCAIVRKSGSLGRVEREWLDVLAAGATRCKTGARHADSVRGKAVGSHFELINRLCCRLKMRLSKSSLSRKTDCSVVSEAGGTEQCVAKKKRRKKVL